MGKEICRVCTYWDELPLKKKTRHGKGVIRVGDCRYPDEDDNPGETTGTETCRHFDLKPNAS